MLLGPFLLDPKGQFRPKNHLTLLSLSEGWGMRNQSEENKEGEWSRERMWNVLVAGRHQRGDVG
jgi:hypothetical protein